MISVVIPVCNEQDNIESLLAELAQVAGKAPIGEFVYVNDGSTDKTKEFLLSLKGRYPQLRVISHNRRCGQSAGLWTGIQAARNPVIATLDGDGQNDPADIEKLYKVFQTEGGPGQAVMVAGQRLKRQDNLVRRLSSRFANGLRAALLKDGTRDTGCSLKIFRREDYLNLPFFNHMHRYLPALMMQHGVKIAHVDVLHRARERGVSKYGTLDRALVGIFDLMGVMWLARRARPKVIVQEE